MIVKNRFGREYNVSDTDHFFQQQLRKDVFQRQNIINLYKLKPNCRTIVDVGANLGSNTIEYATWAKTVHSFEPTTETYNLLCDNIKRNLNPLMKTLFNGNVKDTNIGEVFTHNVALGNTNTFKHIKLFGDNKGRNHIVDGTNTDTNEILVRTLDSYVLVDVDIIKLDVEGYELFVLQGAEKTITTYKPAIQIEIQDILLAKYNLLERDVHDWFSTHNYKCVRQEARDYFYIPK